jgi:hypothetical protein
MKLLSTTTIIDEKAKKGLTFEETVEASVKEITDKARGGVAAVDKEKPMIKKDEKQTQSAGDKKPGGSRGFKRRERARGEGMGGKEASEEAVPTEKKRPRGEEDMDVDEQVRAGKTWKAGEGGVPMISSVAGPANRSCEDQ